MSDSEIEELQQELQQLQLDFNKRTTAINTRIERLRKRKERATRPDSNTSEDVWNRVNFEIGELLEITNKYKFVEKGVQGSAMRISKNRERITIIDKNGKKYIRAPWNLKKVQEV